jgi:hypothetical protein
MINLLKRSILLGWVWYTPAFAQVIITDVVPDETYANDGDSCYIDLDNDGSYDLVISYSRSGSGACGCPPGLVDGRYSNVSARGTEGTAIAVDDQGRAIALDSLEVIGSDLSWLSGGPIMMGSTSPTCAGFEGCVPSLRVGEWSQGTTGISLDKYLGIRKVVSEDTLFGWVRIYIPYSLLYLPSFTLRSYGLGSTSMEAVLAGTDDATQVERVSNSAFASIYPNPTSSSVIIQMEGDDQSWSCRLMNVSGTQVYGMPTTRWTSELHLDMSALPSGAYFLELNSSTGVLMKKIIKL